MSLGQEYEYVNFVLKSDVLGVAYFRLSVYLCIMVKGVHMFLHMQLIFGECNTLNED